MSLPPDDTVNILQLYSRYSTAIDTGDGAGFANCFLPDGVFDSGINVLEGFEAISKFADQTHSAMPGMRHNATNIVIDSLEKDAASDGADTSADRAQGSAFLIGYVVDGGYKVIVTGRYSDELTRTADGWRFSRRVFKMDS
ncbi:MAG: nuclear transport factor 2 family protein [Myxococcales bacterium]|nr:nuclear transport factor 2 family protein [Myxococcales bacterium]HIL81071.1 nuclear transport factor 2 family protein [Myxococcales bacterium]